MSHLGGGRKEGFKRECTAVADDFVARSLKVEETTVSDEVVW
jgi:hypothetical protein